MTANEMCCFSDGSYRSLARQVCREEEGVLNRLRSIHWDAQYVQVSAAKDMMDAQHRSHEGSSGQQAAGAVL